MKKSCYEVKGNPEVTTPIDSLNVYERLQYKFSNNITELDSEERERLEDLYLETVADAVTKVSDDILMEMASQESLFL